jgi:hypothetical protein
MVVRLGLVLPSRYSGGHRGGLRHTVQGWLFRLRTGGRSSRASQRTPVATGRPGPDRPRLFSQIGRNWAAEPLDSYEKALKFIRTTTTAAGLKVTAQLDTTYYPTGVKPSKAELSQLSIRTKRVLPKWNYTISPQM